MNVIGVDLGTRKITCAIFHEGEEGIRLAAVPTYTTEGDKPRAVQLWGLGALASSLASLHDAEFVWIERAIMGNNIKYSLAIAEVVGAVSAACAQIGSDVQLVDNTTWKREVLKNGHASKDDIRNYITVSHPAYALLCEDEQDAYDAACIGIYGITILDRASSLRL